MLLELLRIETLKTATGCKQHGAEKCTEKQFRCSSENSHQVEFLKNQISPPQILSINDWNREQEKCIPLSFRCDGRYLDYDDTGRELSQLSIDLDIKLQIIVAPYESPPVQNFAGSRYRTRYIICRWVRSCQASSGDYKATLNDKEKTPTNTKCLEDPTYVIFLKSRRVSFAQQISVLFELPSLTNMWQISKSFIHIVWGRFPLNTIK